MILRTYRDVEIELRKLQAAINDIPKIKENGGLNTAQVIALINSYAKNTTVVNTVETAPPDLDSSNAGTLIIHKLVHQFLEKVIFDGLVEVAGDLSIGNDLTVNGDAIILGELGTVLQRIAKIWTQELSVLPGLIPPTVGDILTAANTDGTVEWTSPSASATNSIVEASLTFNYAFPAAWTAIPGFIITLNSIGDYFVSTSCNISAQPNDTLVATRIAATNATYPGGNTNFEKAAAVLAGTSLSWNWKVTVVAVPSVISFEIIKVGTGASYIYAGAVMQALKVT